MGSVLKGKYQNSSSSLRLSPFTFLTEPSFWLGRTEILVLAGCRGPLPAPYGN